MQQLDPKPLKDEEREHPVAGVWRPTLREIAKALMEGDYFLSRGIAAVAPVTNATAAQIRASISNYGETLAELPEDNWNSSVSQWMETYWDVIVDLWTRESGRSDMILSVRVFETSDGYLFEIDSVHVP